MYIFKTHIDIQVFCDVFTSSSVGFGFIFSGVPMFIGFSRYFRGDWVQSEWFGHRFY
jgi:hypothetical protein